MYPWTTRRLSAAVCLLALFGCGGSDDDGGSGPPPEDPLQVQAAPTSSGDGQSGPPGAALPEDLRVVITRASEPQQGVEVAWATTGGGSLAPATSVSGADGVATTTWTLGPTVGAQAATATVADADGSPVTFTLRPNRTSRPRHRPAAMPPSRFSDRREATASVRPMSPSRPARLSSGCGPRVPSATTSCRTPKSPRRAAAPPTGPRPTAIRSTPQAPTTSTAPCTGPPGESACRGP